MECGSAWKRATYPQSWIAHVEIKTHANTIWLRVGHIWKYVEENTQCSTVHGSKITTASHHLPELPLHPVQVAVRYLPSHRSALLRRDLSPAFVCKRVRRQGKVIWIRRKITINYGIWGYPSVKQTHLNTIDVTWLVSH